MSKHPAAKAMTKALFDNDEPVIQSHPLLDGAVVPRFGDTACWNLNGVVRRPANLQAAGWKLVFSRRLADPMWNLLARELSMILLNPRHPAMIEAGLSLRPQPSKPSTVIGVLSHLRTLADWAHEQQVPDLSTWGEHDLRRYVTFMEDNFTAGTRVSRYTTMDALHRFRHVLSGGGLAVEPLRGKSATKAAKARKSVTLSTPVVRPETWFPLIRAAWTYVHTFAPDILRGLARHADLLANATDSLTGFNTRLTAWLADPANPIPIHAVPRGGTRSPQPNYRLLALLMGVKPDYGSKLFGARVPDTDLRRRDMVAEAVRSGHPTITGIVDDLAQVTRPDGSTGPWQPGLDPRALQRERFMLRNACFTMVIGLSMMRDSEIHEIAKGSVVEHYGTPAIASTKQKLDSNLPTKHWWITKPVAEAIAVAEQLSVHPERVFAPLHNPRVTLTVSGERMLDSFIAHINATRKWTGLEAMPEDKVRPHMFRHTMAMLTDEFAGSEIALGIQLKHVATRALANRTTIGYAAADVSWAKHLDSAIEAARFRRLEDLYNTHAAGAPIGFGPAAERIAKTFDQIQQAVKARNGDTAVQRALLRQSRISLRFGTLNNCALDENNPVGAICLENAVLPPGHKGGLLDRCRPARCANAMFEPQHIPIYITERGGLRDLMSNPGLAPVRKEALQRELDEVEAVLRKAGHSLEEVTS